MIKVEIFGNKSLPEGFRSQGHAGYNQAGYDIVCAGVSALTITCANALEEIAHCPVKATEEEGYLEIMIGESATQIQRYEGALLIKAMVLGLKDIAQNYPKHVQVIE